MLSSSLPSYRLFKRWWLVVVLLALEVGLVVYQAFRFPVVDQTLWLVSAPAFFNALSRGDFAGTYASTILAHPGVTLEWLWGIAKLVSLLLGGHFLAQSVILLILTVKLALIGWSGYVVRRWLNPIVILACIVIWLTHPLLFGATASWLDQLLGIFLWLVTLWWLTYTQERRAPILVLGGVLVGLAGLTKVAAIFIFPMLMVPTWRFFRQRWWWQGLVIMGLIGSIIFILLYPAMWVNPWHTLSARATTASGTGVSPAGSVGLMSLLLYPYYIFQDAILSLGVVGLSIQAIRYIHRKGSSNPVSTQLAVAGAVYIVCLMAVGLLASDHGSGAFSFMNYRYLTPAVLLLSPLPIELASHKLPRWGFWLLVGVILLVQLWQGPIISTWLGHPPSGI